MFFDRRDLPQLISLLTLFFTFFQKIALTPSFYSHLLHPSLTTPSEEMKTTHDLVAISSISPDYSRNFFPNFFREKVFLEISSL